MFIFLFGNSFGFFPGFPSREEDKITFLCADFFLSRKKMQPSFVSYTESLPKGDFTMKHFLLSLVCLLCLSGAAAGETLPPTAIVGLAGDEFIHQFTADNGQTLYFTALEEEPFVQYQDVNFDGVADIAIICSRGASNAYSKFFVHINGTYQPVTVWGLGYDLANVQLHPEEKWVSSHARNGAAGAQFDKCLFRWEGKDLRLVRRAESGDYIETLFTDETYTTITHLDQLHVTFRDYSESEYEGILYHEEMLPLSAVTDEIMEQWDALLWQGP